MSRRHSLKVDTFPFLAVLLCAMGSLILVLLVMDRRSKLAARQRVAEQVRKQTEDVAATRARRREEYEAKKRVRDGNYARKRDALTARINAEEKSLDSELREVQSRLSEAASKLRKEEENVESLRGQLKSEKAKLVSQEKTLEGARDEAKTLTEKLSEADKARAKLAADLVKLEGVLSAMLESRKREAQTYSVVPYSGKRGENRRPLYIECADSGMVFHPDKLKLQTPSPEALRSEVKRRIAKQAEDLAAEGVSGMKPYLMLLVRPNGILRHYELQSVAKELGIDFGYEFVDSDWVLNIPTNGTPSSATANEIAPTTRPTSNTPPSMGLPGGSSLLAKEGSTLEGNGPSIGGPILPGGGGHAKDGSSTTALPGGNAGTLPSPNGGGGIGIGESGHPAANGGVAGNKPNVSNSSIGLSPPLPFSASLETTPPHPDAPVVSMHRPVARPEEKGTTGIEPPALPGPSGGTAPTPSQPQPQVASTGTPPHATTQPTPSGTTPGPGQRPGGGSGEAGGTGEVGPSFAPVPADAKPLPMRPARINSADDTMIFIECRADSVVVYPARKQIGIDSLSQTPPHNQLTQSVNQIIAQQQARVRQGMSPARFHVRFLVHPNGELTYHRAYPAVETISVPKTRYNLLADDNVARIISGY